MYFVDQQKMEEILTYMDTVIDELKKQSSSTTFLDKMAKERMTHIVIESILDVGNMMIDGFIMRDPGSYEDIIDILLDENVLEAEHEHAYKRIIELRKQIVNNYREVDHNLISDLLNDHLEEIAQFSKYIQTYLQNELGVANAFSNPKG
ncbi:hypothetical conserved protein [Oceanobacillus iheyensis HTE831]|uniref:Hypothetical conserved protein n=1 Tax=Oceanobacillus iheyensis (strain DSM 14371 / CIP 107618 / JCM 11309 / KCTC 3954 / HTE831) TaxID=221109 RepID=Q8ENW4_OCEIH|nr:DUF86 domain-containing protein [Oceanobacillus iheyensis]BAC14318.1 hypothetical conserved protein [Oceanobacillus iheyensis HTE831]